MKRGTPDHPKMVTLARLLNINQAWAVGIVEMLWHFTAKYAHQGDIGKHTDAAIARAVGWDRPSGERGVKPECRLSEALVEAGWLDRDPVHRLVVHDWADHADESVRKFLSRRGLDCVRPVSSLPLPLPIPLPEPQTRVPISEGKRSTMLKAPMSSCTMPEWDELAARMYARHPNKAGRVLFEQRLSEALTTATNPAETATRIERAHAAWLPTWERENGRFAPRLDRWIADGRFLDDPPGEEVPEPECPTTDDFRRAELQ